MTKKKLAVSLYIALGLLVFLTVYFTEPSPDFLGNVFLACVALLFWPFMLFNVALAGAYSFAVSAGVVLLNLILLSIVFWLWLSAPHLPQQEKLARESVR